MAPSKPREWWIEMAEQCNSDGEAEIVPVLWTFDPGSPFNDGLVHVIEHAAYAALLAEAEALREALEQKQWLIGQMDAALIWRGVNFDFDEALARFDAFKKRSGV